MNMAYNYGKLALHVLAALSGKNNGVVARLIDCGLIKSIDSISSNLMHDFKTGHLPLTSPRSMLVSQGIGSAIGCIVAPFTFFLYKAFDMGNLDEDCKAGPHALIYRNMVILGVEGFSALQHHCLQMCYVFFSFAILANLLRDVRRTLEVRKIGSSPNGNGRTVPRWGIFRHLYVCRELGGVCSGYANSLVPAVASGLICGDGLWILPSSILALAKINPPICMDFSPWR